MLRSDVRIGAMQASRRRTDALTTPGLESRSLPGCVGQFESVGRNPASDRRVPALSATSCTARRSTSFPLPRTARLPFVNFEQINSSCNRIVGSRFDAPALNDLASRLKRVGLAGSSFSSLASSLPQQGCYFGWNAITLSDLDSTSELTTAPTQRKHPATDGLQCEPVAEAPVQSTLPAKDLSPDANASGHDFFNESTKLSCGSHPWISLALRSWLVSPSARTSESRRPLSHVTKAARLAQLPSTGCVETESGRPTEVESALPELQNGSNRREYCSKANSWELPRPRLDTTRTGHRCVGGVHCTESKVCGSSTPNKGQS